MNLAPKLLAEHQQSQVRARALKGQCLDCLAAREDGGNPHCNICLGVCCNCGNPDVAIPGHVTEDGRQEWWCNACNGPAEPEPRDLDTRDIEPFERGEAFK